MAVIAPFFLQGQGPLNRKIIDIYMYIIKKFKIFVLITCINFLKFKFCSTNATETF